jgi:hypothetical protein
MMGLFSLVERRGGEKGMKNKKFRPHILPRQLELTLCEMLNFI